MFLPFDGHGYYFHVFIHGSPPNMKKFVEKNVALTCVGTDTENKSVLLQKCLEFIPNDSDDTWKIL